MTPSHGGGAEPRTLNAVVVEVQVLQVAVERGDGGELVVGELQVQQGGDVEHGLGDPLVAQLVVVEPHKGEVREAAEVVSARENDATLHSPPSIPQMTRAPSDHSPRDVVDTVPVQEELDESAGNSGRHLLQHVVGQIELHETRQVLEHVLPQVTVAELRTQDT